MQISKGLQIFKRRKLSDRILPTKKTINSKQISFNFFNFITKKKVAIIVFELESLNTISKYQYLSIQKYHSQYFYYY